MKKIVVFTGAGISAESGIKTFRDTDGLWEEYKISDVATPEAWVKNASLVIDFYNQRRKQVLQAKPNEAHLTLSKLEEQFEVHIITQNIDDLHERAGSSRVLHLHGEILKSRSTADPALIYPIQGWELKLGDKCSKGSQLRPHIVWFGESVPNMERAQHIASRADIFIIIGTSLNVYPAAGLVEYAPEETPKYLVDPNPVSNSMFIKNLHMIREKAGKGVTQLAELLLMNP
ncbi:MAG TPA: NAD-dependent deacylase [Bacteroidia bacterium]|jgi:NAD-dependent deacetylase|nr:NAD-dependent deacylase [Bacteroidia bacterium]